MSKGSSPRDPARRKCTDEEYARRHDETFMKKKLTERERVAVEQRTHDQIRECLTKSHT